ncbi:MAG TPA: hypothetical protein VG148_01155 [Pyrinomonadaceae bacterium]|nr:hypothetical protein [Pyrinomonadaceae bacterium]
MKTFRPVSHALLTVILVSLSAPAAAAQKRTLPPELNQNSSLKEILDYLDRNSFPRARIGLKSRGPESYTDYSDPVNSLTLYRTRLSEEVVLSQGFRLAIVDGCELVLKNDDVQIANWWTKSFNPHVASLSDFVLKGEKGEAPLKPQSALIIIPLDKMSHRKGKGPYRHTKDAEEARRLGAWRTKFQNRGFFKRSIFGMEVYAAEPRQTSERTQAETITFTFDDKEASERFNAAFRQAIKLCTAE